MLKSILIGLDGSPFSPAVIELGIGLARQFGALLAGLAVVDEPAICGPESVPLGATAFKKHRDELRLAEARKTVAETLRDFGVRCGDAGVSSRSIEAVGVPSEQILLEAQRCDLVLLGQRTYFHFETQDEPDDTLHSVVKNSPRPVIAVPEKPHRATSVVVAYDGSLQAARTLQAFQCLGMGRSGAVHLVCVHDDQEEAARRAERAVEYLRLHEIAAHPQVVATSAPPARVILEKARAFDAGLLVMGAYGQPTLREFFFGSVTRTVLHECNVPVFLYH
ncbi:MAG: universal stress protein [Deltaproteobacteria bacterium]